MNIGIVTTWFDRGAAYVSRQYKNILEHDHNVFIFDRGEAVPDPGLQWKIENVTRGRKPRLRQHVDMDLRQFRRWLRRNRIDLVLFNEQRWWPPVWTARDLGITTAAYVDYYTERTIPAFGLYDILLCNTRRHLEAFQWHPNAIYIPWGTNIEVFKPPYSLNKDEAPPVKFFHNVGMSPDRKGTKLLLLAAQKITGSYEVIIHTQIGLENSGEELSLLLDQCSSSRRINVICKTVQPPGLYHLGHVYVYPTFLEGIGLSVPEALACGLPCIVPDYPPMNEFVKNGVNGHTISIEKLTSRCDAYYWPKCHPSIDSLAQRMQWYIDHPSEIKKLSASARKDAVQHLNWKHNASNLSSILANTPRLVGSVVDQARHSAETFEASRSLLPRILYFITKRFI